MALYGIGRGGVVLGFFHLFYGGVVGGGSLWVGFGVGLGLGLVWGCCCCSLGVVFSAFHPGTYEQC